MDVQFMYNYSDARVINKVLATDGEGVGVFEGQARDAINIMAPTIVFDTNAILRYNYAYIPELQRYYSVNSITATYDNLYAVSFEVDVLMSFRNHILQLPVIVDKQSMPENGDEYIDDSSLIADNVMFTTVYNYPNGFNDTPEFILITAG